MSAVLPPNDDVTSSKKRKARFTFSEVHTLLDEVRKNKHIVVGKFNRGVPTDVKKRTWVEITARVNEVGDSLREVIEVIKKWSDLKCDTKRKVAALRAGAVPYRNINSRLSWDLSPIENIVHQILELDGKRGRLPTSDRNFHTGVAQQYNGVDEDEEEEDDDDVVMLEVPPSVCDSAKGRLGVSPCPLPPVAHEKPVPLSEPSPVTLSVPPASHFMPLYTQTVESGEERRAESLLPSRSSAEEMRVSSLVHSTPAAADAAGEGPTPSSSAAAQACTSAHDGMMESAALSMQEQHRANMLLRTVSRSLELLSESVQQLVETQQEFVHDSLQLQRETVFILRDFAAGALSLMHDKLNGRPAV